LLLGVKLSFSRNPFIITKNTKEKSIAKGTRVADHLGVEWEENKI
jgi:hypothetical protein